MLKSLYVATPATAVTVLVPDRIPLLGLVPMAMVTLPVKLVAVFPATSCAATFTAGVMVAVASVLVGCTVNTRFAAGPAVMLKAALVSGVRPLAVAASR